MNGPGVNRRLIIWLSAAAALGAGAIAVIAFVQKNHDLNSRVMFDATPDKVWRVLNDFPGYAEWNPHLRAMDGQPKAYSPTRLKEIFSDGREMIRQIHMKSMARDYEFIWEGDLSPLPRMLTAKRKLIMTPTAQGGTMLRHEIEFRGWLSGPLSQSVFDRYALSMAAMNTALTGRVDQEK